MEYSQAFDLALVGRPGEDGPILALVSSTFHAVEIMRRWQAPLHFYGPGGWDVAGFIPAAQSWAWGPLEDAAQTAGERYQRCIWAEPEAGSSSAALRLLAQKAAAGARLSVIASGPLHRFLPAWKTAPFPAQNPLMAHQAASLLKKTGWRVDSVTAFHGPGAVMWSVLWRIAGALGRPDWADRCLFGMRRNYRRAGMFPPAPLYLIQAVFQEAASNFNA